MTERKTPQKFAVFDIDGTLIRWQLFHAIVHELGQAGHFSSEAHERVVAARKKWKVREGEHGGFRTYELVLINEYLAALKGMDCAVYEAIEHEVFETYKDQAYVYTRKLFQDLKSQGYIMVAITGSPEGVIQKLADYYGFDIVRSAKFHKDGGTFTGEIYTPIFEKAKVLKQLIKEHNLDSTDSYAIGDSKSDAAMLKLVSNPIAFNPDKGLLIEAQKHHWKIVIERKSVAYELIFQNGSYVFATEALATV
jgi:HAD superfamily hydrolase (TIGR01490 family)